MLTNNKARSLDEIEKITFAAKNSPIDKTFEAIALLKGSLPTAEMKNIISLDGEWEFSVEKSFFENDCEPFTAQVPCSVFTALYEAGKIPNPNYATNQKIANEYSYKTWWLRKTFSFNASDKSCLLVFEGVANACTVWLNGELLSEHEGMFGGPYINIEGKLKKENELLVKLDPIPLEFNNPNRDFQNISWQKTVVINNVYGWHYSNLPSLGIWQPVYIVAQSKIRLDSPFVFTKNAHAGQIALHLPIINNDIEGTIELSVEISPKNFVGESFYFTKQEHAVAGENEFSYDISIDNPHLWWPNDVGEQNLYNFNVTLNSSAGKDSFDGTFGIRTVEMLPTPGGEKENEYNWTFCVNGKEMFVKGSGWCTADALLDCSRERYDRFLHMAKLQHVQMLRAWGCGFPETDDFFDLCDEYGIMIMLEWPTAWNSHNTQPYDMLKDVVNRHTKRLRNRPSLVMYGGGNESSEPFGDAIDMMGRLSIELDGTRPFHRGEPFGGSRHDYSSYWDRKHIDAHFVSEAVFFGEFGLPSFPNIESVERYLPRTEMMCWPPKKDGSMIYHLPVFGYVDCVERMMQNNSYFLSENFSFKELLCSTQLSQSLCVVSVNERSRCRYPECTGVLHYKLNDNFPAVSWATVDYYGTAKPSFYTIKNSLKPLHVCMLFERLNSYAMPLETKVYLLDDLNSISDEKDLKVTVDVYNGELKHIKQEVFYKETQYDRVNMLGSVQLNEWQTSTYPLFYKLDMHLNGKLIDRTFYYRNIEYSKGCLFNLPKCSLEYEILSDSIKIKNIGSVPAVGVTVQSSTDGDSLILSDNFLWLEADESVEIQANYTKNLYVYALNSF